jgi:hypothetical protein
MSETLDLLREQLRELEMDAVLIRGRTEQLRDTIGLLENGPRRKAGRPRNAAALNPAPPQLGAADILEMPERVGGAAHEPPPEAA